MSRKRGWMIISVSAIGLSILSLFLPVFSYRSARTGITTKYNIIKLFSNSELIENMFTEYRGEFLRGMGYSSVSTLVIVLCFIGVTAIILAFVGIGSMTKQYESAWPFGLALSGLIGTAIPSVTLLILFLFSQNQYAGKMTLGAYIIITPVAMVLACINVVNRHRLTREELRLQRAASAFIRPAGDLPVQ